MLNVFIGYDHRQPVAFNVAAHSVIRNCTKPVAIHALRLDTLPITRRGLTEFTYSRFLVPFLCDFKGDAVFMDSDVIVLGDIAELFESCRAQKVAVCVNQAQEKFEWPSVMYFNNPECAILTPDYVDDMANNLMALDWATSLGNIQPEWNHCIGYADDPKEGELLPKLLHFTEGVPVWAETMGISDLEGYWKQERMHMMHTVDWTELMSKSVHAKKTLMRFIQQRIGKKS